jgi:acyl-coenzyme A thioesterase PaaI-like protein
MTEAAGIADQDSSEDRLRLPWDLHPALTEQRLSACARLLAQGRADAVAMADIWAGDDA